MALLSDEDRFNIWAKCMVDMTGESCTILKSELRDAVNSIDQWVEDNTTSFNSSIPQPARGALTTKQKVRLLKYILNQRYNVQ